jgi:hypothetical protein
MKPDAWPIGIYRIVAESVGTIARADGDAHRLSRSHELEWRDV